MNGEEFRQALHSGRRVYGSAVTSASPLYLEALNGLGLDWVFIDNEHSPINRESTAWLCQAYFGAGIVPVVRVPAAEPHLASLALDGGAKGIIVPYVEEAEVARRMVGAVKLRPPKGRKLREVLGDGPGLEDRTPAYVRDYNRAVSLIINMESSPAMENLEELCSVEGVDAVLIGPHDLSVSLGVPEQYEHPRYVEAVLEILRTARSYGIGAGIHHSTGIEQEKFFVTEGGANLVAHSEDIVLAASALEEGLVALRKEFGDEREGGTTSRRVGV